MWPASASRRSVISASRLPKDSTEISRSRCRISTKRDMCVPLKLCGRFTYMLKFATVCCSPSERSFTRTGWLMSLMPTWLIGICRVSARFCTSSTVMTRGWGAVAAFIGVTVCGLSGADQPLIRIKASRQPIECAKSALCSAGDGLGEGHVLPESSDRRFQAAEVELGRGETVLARTVFDEAIRDAQGQRRQHRAAVREQFDDGRAGTAGHRVLLDGHERGVRAREAHHQLFVEWFDE